MATPQAPRQVTLSHDQLVAQLESLNKGGRARDVLAFADANAQAVGSSPAIALAVAAAALATGDHPRSEAMHRKVLELEPGHSSTIVNLAMLLIKRDAFEEAESLLRALLGRDPAQVEARYNLAVIHLRRGEFSQADNEARRVLEYRPNHERAPFLLGLSLLTQGRYAEGWPGFETRVLPVNSGGNVTTPSLPYPAWRGEPLAGKSILVWMEQGLGDEIMMARYAAVLKGMGAKVSWICRPAMAPLLRGVEGIDNLYVASGELSIPRHDYWVLPMSLPFACGTTLETIPSRNPYIALRSSSRRADEDLLAPPKFRVGVVWKGGPALANDRNRSLPGLSTLRTLWTVPGVEFVSLQKGAGEEEGAHPPAGQPLTDLAPGLTDLAQTAAAIEDLDLVISVDTAVAHLAGALGKPCFVMLPALGLDWRWHTGRSDSPWYPSLTLYRQTTPGDWEPVVAQMTAALTGLAAGR
jgi:hypothetical protein